MTPNPKARKSLPSLQTCEQCKIIMNSKDFLNHGDYCGSKLPLACIKNGILYCVLDSPEIKGIPLDMNEVLAKEVVVMSVQACQICNFRLGFPVLIEIDGYRTVKNAWPSSDTSGLLSASLSKKEIEINSGLTLSDRLTVSVPDNLRIYIAEEVYYQILSDDTEANVKSLSETFHFKFKYKYLHTNLILRLPFFGRTLVLKIVHINSIKKESNDDDISKQMNELSLKDIFYSHQPFTCWLHERLLLKNQKEKEIRIFGGYVDLVSELQKRTKFIMESGEKSSLGILLYGIHGTGKTSLAHKLGEFSQRDIIVIKGLETEIGLKSKFEEAKRQAPCIIIIDMIDLLLPKKGTDQERRLFFPLNFLMESVRSYPILIIATAVDPDDVEASLRRPGKLEIEIELGVPSAKDRFTILQALVPDESLTRVLEQLAAACHGFVAGDLASLVDVALSDGGRPLTSESLLNASRKVKPSVMRELRIEVPKVKWNDIGGGEEVKQCLRQAVEWPLKHPDVLKKLGIKPHSGVLLYGPPGCSKTLVAKALASESGLNFISIKGSDVFSKWVGESEKAIRDVFRKARSVAPSIVFFDEVEALASERGEAETASSVHARVLSELLSALDGIEPLEGVTILAATNRPDRIDSAMLRPGRFDRLIYVPLPDFSTRLQILQIESKKRPISPSVNLEEISNLTEGYSGAEIASGMQGVHETMTVLIRKAVSFAYYLQIITKVVSVCNEASLLVVSELIAHKERNIAQASIGMSHFQSALLQVTPRTPQYLLDLYNNFQIRKI